MEGIPIIRWLDHRQIDAYAGAMLESLQIDPTPNQQFGPDRAAHDDQVSVAGGLHVAATDAAVDVGRELLVERHRIISNAFLLQLFGDIGQTFHVPDCGEVP